MMPKFLDAASLSVIFALTAPYKSDTQKIFALKRFNKSRFDIGSDILPFGVISCVFGSVKGMYILNLFIVFSSLNKPFFCHSFWF